MLMLTLILIAGFKTCNGTKPNALTKSSTTMNKPTTSTQTLAERPTFVSDIRPILQSRCQPCHFQGGQMYQKLPFDKPETITKLGHKVVHAHQERGPTTRHQGVPVGTVCER
jgi:hypothetical protein